MKGFEYEITKHPAEAFKQIIYFCTVTGQCRLDEVPSDQTDILANMLNVSREVKEFLIVN